MLTWTSSHLLTGHLGFWISSQSVNWLLSLWKVTHCALFIMSVCAKVLIFGANLFVFSANAKFQGFHFKLIYLSKNLQPINTVSFRHIHHCWNQETWKILRVTYLNRLLVLRERKLAFIKRNGLFYFLQFLTVSNFSFAEIY